MKSAFLKLVGCVVLLVTLCKPERASGSACIPCCSPCIHVCCPSWGCFGRASNPFHFPHEPRSVLVWLPCCPHHVPTYTWAYIYRYECWRRVHVFHIYHGQPPQGDGDFEAPAPSPVPKMGDASVTIHLPRNAKLSVNDEPREVKGRTFKFVPKSLEAGVSYTYVFQCEVERAGKSERSERRVIVKAGQNLEVDFEMPQPKAPEAREATLLIKTPAGAKLAINKESAPLASRTQGFVVTDLQPGKEYSCELTCDVDGNSRTMRQKLTVRAGDIIRIDFNAPESTRVTRSR